MMHATCWTVHAASLHFLHRQGRLLIERMDIAALIAQASQLKIDGELSIAWRLTADALTVRPSVRLVGWLSVCFGSGPFNTMCTPKVCCSGIHWLSVESLSSVRISLIALISVHRRLGAFPLVPPPPPPLLRLRQSLRSSSLRARLLHAVE